MDRNLGARNTKFPEDAKGALQYIFGRKDPIVSIVPDGSLETTAYVGRTSSILTIDVEVSATGVVIAYVVNRPLLYVGNSSSTWCSDVQSERYIWHDSDHDIDSNGKSIFDPSPYGWKVPHIGVWSNFSEDTMTAWNDGFEDGQIGRSYPAIDPIAFYPSSGWRNSSSGTMVSYIVYGQYVSSTPASTTLSHRMNFTSTGVTSLGGVGRTSSRSVRPVQHFEHLFGK